MKKFSDICICLLPSQHDRIAYKIALNWQYFQFPQIAIILTILGYGFATLYYLDYNERLKPVLKNQLIGLMSAVVFIVIIVGDWQDKSI